MEHVCDLWGHHGELWTPKGRIQDVSNAGFEVSLFTDERAPPSLHCDSKSTIHVTVATRCHVCTSHMSSGCGRP